MFVTDCLKMFVTSRGAVLYVYIYIYIYMSEAIHETGLSGNVVASLFPSHNIYSALLQRIEHCSMRKSTCRLPIYIYIFILYIYILP